MMIDFCYRALHRLPPPKRHVPRRRGLDHLWMEPYKSHSRREWHDSSMRELGEVG
jgi:hypothetical protein